MHFPQYVTDPRLSEIERSRARLRFMLDRCSMHLNGKRSLRALARAIDMSHPAIVYAIHQGKCTAEMALRIEAIVGRQHTKHEWLRLPLECPSEPSDE